MNVLLVGGGGREHAIAASLRKNPQTNLFTIMSNQSPGIIDLSDRWVQHAETDVGWIVKWATAQSIDLAMVGFEDPLGLGICDELDLAGIPSVGPRKQGARLETSKLYTRLLMEKYAVPGQVEFYHFTETDALRRFLLSSDKEFALKPIGLTAGKGVKVMGDQLASIGEAIRYGCEVIERGIGGSQGIILEERLIGDEFTLQCFVDGVTIAPMPAVQDFKRAFEGDQGPNTGGMGSYSQADGLLPFLIDADYSRALDILRGLLEAFRSEGEEYKGILYGQFMLTADGPKLVEVNARFGDPEAINVLPLMTSDVVGIYEAIINGSLDKTEVRFDRKATVCKYVVPPGYPSDPKQSILAVDELAIAKLGAAVFYAKVNRDGDRLVTTSSRSLAILGVGESLEEADRSAEQALGFVEGAHYVRHDIGKPVRSPALAKA